MVSKYERAHPSDLIACEASFRSGYGRGHGSWGSPEMQVLPCSVSRVPYGTFDVYLSSRISPNEPTNTENPGFAKREEGHNTIIC